MRILFIIIFHLCLIIPFGAFAAEYQCEVRRCFMAERECSKDYLTKFQLSNKVEETSDGTFVSRCSFTSSEGKITCDRYKADHIATDTYIKAKKFYFFRSQFDLQLFQDLSFVENNGRGQISYGVCRLTAP